MSTTFSIYLIMQLNSINVLLAFIMIFSLVASVAALLIKAAYSLERGINNETTNEKDNKIYITISRWFKKSAIVALTSTILFTLMPSTKTAIHMIGGAGVVEVLQSEQAREIGGKAYQLLMKKLDEELAK